MTIVEEKLETAKEFLDVLRVSNPRWMSERNDWEVAWIFRGQPDATMSLLPSAWRAASLERFKQQYRARLEEMRLEPLKRELEAIEKQIAENQLSRIEGEERKRLRTNQELFALEVSLQSLAEMLAVREFTEFADKLGHPVPEADKFFPTQYGFALRDLTEAEYLAQAFYSIHELHNPLNVNCSAVALARHHGVPTRLLDWTENSLIAAFFAAVNLSEEYEDKNIIPADREIVVWALSKEVCSTNNPALMRRSPLQLITRPRYEIGYLLAQKGVFTHDEGANSCFQETGRWRPIEEAVNDNPDYLKKLTLPASEVGELLRLLWLEGISRAHLMPTYDNVTRALQTKAWWEGRSTTP